MPAFSMRGSLEDRLFRRELASERGSRYTKPRGIYGTRTFIDDLDIINELNGHNGCVNALSWSKSGRLLASGSDDRVINIHSYLPEYSNNQFDLATQIDTGHTRNIFSVKFMPHSNDRTIVSAAGDSQIRVFDIERANVFEGTRARLSQNQANCKVFRSHSAAAKRIVTEASPFYFLSCAEDGDVRQWDVRQPESAYPRSQNRFYTARTGRTKDDAPPALISYGDYNIDLMSISCSPSQPHYIALGGTALHCFLHDRRMTGRDRLKERGTAPIDENELAEATRCVKKFAPYGQPKMRRSDPKSITACKISDNNPNELIASWNGDFIYSFDIMRDDNTSSNEYPGFSQRSKTSRVKDKARKRKRKDANGSGLSRIGDDRGSSRQRTESASSEGQQELSLLLQMEGGESVEIPLPSRAFPDSRITRVRSGERSEGETIAQQVRQVRNTLMNTSQPASSAFRPDVQSDEPALIRNRLDQVLASSLKLLENLDTIIRDWTYPTTESRNQIAFQQKLREDRAKTWRFVQACGTLSRVASQKPASSCPQRLLELFDVVKPAPRESSMPLERHEHFAYDFLKCILLWLDSGVGAVLREFTHDPDNPQTSYRKRRPVSLDADIDAVELELLPYLLRMASETAIDDLDDESGQAYIFRTEADAVRALARAMRIPFADLAGEAAAERDGAGKVLSQNRETAVRFWAYRVGRAVLKNAAVDVTYSLVDTAFGEFMGAQYNEAGAEPSTNTVETEDDDEESDEDDNDDDEDVALSDSSENESSSEDDDTDDHIEGTFLLGAAAASRQARPKMTAGRHVPALTHTNLYRGHCNVETTKDVNFFGLQDEYVISGSDDGNFFIWDKKSGRLLNVLEGDGEVVNVVQGHPYEPIIAVSGIDSTVKIFGGDARARKDAALGIGIEEIDREGFSSIGLRTRRNRQRRQREMMDDFEVSF